MEVHFNKDVAPVASRLDAPKPRPPQAAGETADFRQADSLDQALQAAPEVRPDAVERGRQLVSNVPYPPIETIRKLAALLVINLDAEDQ